MHSSPDLRFGKMSLIAPIRKFLRWRILMNLGSENPKLRLEVKKEELKLFSMNMHELRFYAAVTSPTLQCLQFEQQQSSDHSGRQTQDGGQYYGWARVSRRKQRKLQLRSGLFMIIKKIETEQRLYHRLPTCIILYLPVICISHLDSCHVYLQLLVDRVRGSSRVHSPLCKATPHLKWTLTYIDINIKQAAAHPK